MFGRKKKAPAVIMGAYVQVQLPQSFADCGYDYDVYRLMIRHTLLVHADQIEREVFGPSEASAGDLPALADFTADGLDRLDNLLASEG